MDEEREGGCSKMAVSPTASATRSKPARSTPYLPTAGPTPPRRASGARSLQPHTAAHTAARQSRPARGAGLEGQGAHPAGMETTSKPERVPSGLAVDEASVILLPPPSPFSRCINSDGERASAK